MRIALFDYGTGNLHSLGKALARGGHFVRIEHDVQEALNADALVLPGVGAFGAAASRLAPDAELIRRALADGFPCLGVCLGMQLLFESSEEGAGPGLGAIAGHVRRLRVPRVPQMGWNEVRAAADPLFADADPLVAYYANSYVVEPADPEVEIAWSEYYGDRFAAAVRTGRTWGVQFHPEKSGLAGLVVIENFLRQAAS
jgi:glutamine amidotransferase